MVSTGCQAAGVDGETLKLNPKPLTVSEEVVRQRQEDRTGGDAVAGADTSTGTLCGGGAVAGGDEHRYTMW